MPRLVVAAMLLGLGALGVLLPTLALTSNAGYRSWAYHYFREDYAKAGWVYERMIARPDDAANLFMGSSHVLNAVDDELIDRLLAPGSAYNAAIPTSGRNLEYVVLRDIFLRNRPKRLFLEVRETEERTNHFGFPIIGTISDVAGAPINPWWPRDMLAMLQHRFEYLSSGFIANKRDGARVPQFGFVVNPSQVASDKLARDAEVMDRTKRWRLLPAPFGDIEFRANMIYVEQIARMCRELGIEMHFLHLPYVGAPAEPLQAGFYRSLGTLHLLPDAIRNDQKLWADITHFNAKGAEVYSRWIVDEILRAK